MFLLKRGSLSKIRKDANGVDELQKEGFTLIGECDENGKVTSTSVVIEKAKRTRQPKPEGTQEAGGDQEQTEDQASASDEPEGTQEA